MGVRRIDAHHHLWHYTAEEFSWIDDRMSTLRRDFLPSDLEHALHAANVSSAIAVQARSSLDESRFLLRAAAHSTAICAVVGWVPLTDPPALQAALDELCQDLRFVGVREITQGKTAGFLDQPAFRSGIASLTARGLTYDLLVFANQLPEATRLIDAHPEQRFILDHCAKPNILSGNYTAWSQDLRELARRPNITCKLSGLVTEGNWATWTLADLRPVLDLCVELFGPTRLLAASDWPVCLVATSYTQWWSTLETYFASFSETEREQIFSGTAARVYRLDTLPPSASPLPTNLA